MDIPVQNVFYLLSYAWGEYEAGDLIDLASIEAETPGDLLAHLLVQATRRLLKQGVDRGYDTKTKQVSGIRGQVDFGKSVSRMLLPRAKSLCRVDELTHDVLHNRLLKATLREMAKSKNIKRKLRSRLARLARKFGEVDDVELRTRYFSRLQLDRNSRFYRLVMSLCRLVSESVFISDTDGENRFANFLEDEARMHHIFERFVLNYYRREVDEVTASAKQLAWNAVPADETAAGFLPGMQTDITIETGAGALIIDTKYYRKPLQQGQFKKSVYSDHLYQLFAYLNSYGEPSDVSGMLLYPSVGKSLQLEYEIEGYPVKVCTVDLDQSWTGIRDRLNALLTADFPSGQNHS
jgi:5-methylcytosine-specific restriction enzyme subunit McrC